MLESQHRSPLDVGESCSSERLTSAKSLVEGLSTETMVVGSPCMPVEALLIERGYFDLNGIEGWIVRFKPCMKSFFDSSGDGNVIFVPFLFFFVRRTLVMNNWGRLILVLGFQERVLVYYHPRRLTLMPSAPYVHQLTIFLRWEHAGHLLPPAPGPEIAN